MVRIFDFPFPGVGQFDHVTRVKLKHVILDTI